MTKSPQLNDAPAGRSAVDEPTKATVKEGGDLPLLVRETTTSVVSYQPPSLIRRIFLKLRFLPFVILFGATVGVVALYFQPPGLKLLMGVLQLEPGGGTNNPIAVPANGAVDNQLSRQNPAPAVMIIGLGKLLPQGDIRTVAPPFGAGDARIARLNVDEGQTVQVGEVLAGLDNEGNISAIIENARATVEARRATLIQIRTSIEASREETTASLQRAQSALNNTRQEYDRAKALFDRGYTTRSVLDQKGVARDQALGEVDRLKATLARFVSGSIDTQPDVVVADRHVDTALSELRRAESDLSKTQVTAPITGTVLEIFVRSGERPGQAGILTIGDISKMTAEVEIYQTDIGAVKLGAAVNLTAEALGSELAGTVSRIGLEVGTQTLVDSSPAANTDARVVKVTVALDAASSKLASRYTNLQVLARISVEKDVKD